VETFGALKKRHGNRHIDVRRRGQPKKRTKVDGGSRKKLAAARRGMTRRAGVARSRGRDHKGPTVEQRRRKKRTRDNVASGTSKGRTFGKKRRAQSESSNGIQDRGSRRQLCLRKDRATGNGIRGRSRRQEPRLGSRTTIN
jgi:hypothetical protein